MEGWTHAWMHAWMHAGMRSWVHGWMHARIHAWTHAWMHAWMYPCLHAFMHAFLHSCIHVCISCMHPCMHLCMHGYMLGCISEEHLALRWCFGRCLPKSRGHFSRYHFGSHFWVRRCAARSEDKNGFHHCMALHNEMRSIDTLCQNEEEFGFYNVLLKQSSILCV